MHLNIVLKNDKNIIILIENIQTTYLNLYAIEYITHQIRLFTYSVKLCALNLISSFSESRESCSSKSKIC